MLEDINLFYVSISLIPALFNLVIFAYISQVYPGNKEVNIFLVFVLTLIIWQTQDSLMRLNIDEETARFVSRSLDVGWMFIGAVVVHFVCHFVELEIVKRRYFLSLIYGVTAVLYIINISDISPVILTHDPKWGYIKGIRPGSLDILGRAWVSLLSVFALGVLLHAYMRRDLDRTKRNQAFVIFCGGILPVVQGVITQFYFSAIGMQDVPLTSTSLTGFSVASVIALRKYQLFDVSSFISSETIVNEIENGVIVLSPTGSIAYLNPSARKLFGFQEKTREIGDMKQFFDTEAEHIRFRQDVSKLLLGKSQHKYRKVMLKSLSGECVHLLFTARSLVYGKSQRGILIVFNDVTKLHLATSAIDLYNKRYQFIWKASDEAVWEWVLEEERLSWSENYVALFGHQLKQGASSFGHWESQVHPEDRRQVVDSLNRHLVEKKKGRWEEEYRYMRKDGTYAFVYDKGYLVFDENEQPVRMVGTMQDFTKVRAYIEKIESQNRELSEITWMQSHEVRAPLSRLMGLANHITEFGLEDENGVSLMEEISTSCQELDEIVHKIVNKVDRLRV